jgi:putative holliday junction resolvase
MNILAIDYGRKRIGLAWVDTEMGVVLPFGTIINEKYPRVASLASQFTSSKIINELTVLIEKEKIDKVVIGLPLGLDGKENENTKRVREFVLDLERVIDLPVELMDERFTSKEADSMGGTVSRDEKSAMIILQSYIERLKCSL